MKNRLEQKVTKFTFQLFPILALDGVGDLVGFLDGVGGDGGEVLFDIPRAARIRVS